MKNILITGGGGFIGKNLIKNLGCTSRTIIVLDNFITSNKEDFYKFIEKNELKCKIILYEYDITKSELIDNLEIELQKNNIQVDEIYHLASLASPPFYKKYPIQTLDVGYLGTKNMLELCKKYNCKFLFTSTSEVYGDALITPQHENYYGNVNSFGSRSSYDESKRVAESLCYTYLNQYSLDIKIARIFNTYGPGMMLNDGRIITEVIKSLLFNSVLNIYGNGEQTRSCCYIDDTISMLIRLMDSSVNIPVNIGSDNEKTINESIEIIENIWNQVYSKVTLKKEFKQLTQNDPLQRKPCLILNKKLLGHTDYTPFEIGIKNTINYFITCNQNTHT